MTDVFRPLFLHFADAVCVSVCSWSALCPFFGGRAQTHVEHVLDMGRVALSYGDYITAISLFNRAIEARPYTAEAYYLRAAAKSSLEDYASAATDLKRRDSPEPVSLGVLRLARHLSDTCQAV